MYTLLYIPKNVLGTPCPDTPLPKIPTIYVWKRTNNAANNNVCYYDIIFLTLIGAEKEKVQLASHVLQFVFLGHTGSCFPFAHWPTKEVDPAAYLEVCLLASSRGFSVHYCCCDGGSANRSFIKLHFSGKDLHAEEFTTVNPYTREPLVFLLDPYVSFVLMLKNFIANKDILFSNL